MHIYTLFRVLPTNTIASLVIKRKSRKKLEKVLIILKSIFYLLRTNLHIYNLSIYLERYAETVLQTLLLKKAFCYRYVAYLQRNTHAELLHGCSPINCLNIRGTRFLKNTYG